ncbi:hypothetical protein H6P81_011864 [Aristolochia fimbriata]|uniref:Mitochondrial inner membrane translocase subunit Tim17/Tim22/Tim23/peroxisomal protein PMP24 n=1 Tax=Aristolochia fimbriata TaxID=158543 RepID=A0AAV7ED14_ARIFI|nr:hypothetical protein H6P81_011864 [Aristolochia fimbriata]
MAANSETTNHKPPSDGWKERIYVPTLLAGVVGGGIGLISKRRMQFGTANLSAAYASNFAIVTGCYCSARELVRETRASSPDDLMNSVLGGVLSGALLGRIQGGPLGAVRYSVIFAAVGTTLDYATLYLKPLLRHYGDYSSAEDSENRSKQGWKLPAWSPIQILDEEALAAKRAREQQLLAESVGKLGKEES